MATSSLVHTQETPPIIAPGHGTAALGPSDSTDSGSDIQGGPGLNHDDGLTPPSGNTSDQDVADADDEDNEDNEGESSSASSGPESQ